MSQAGDSLEKMRTCSLVVGASSAVLRALGARFHKLVTLERTTGMQERAVVKAELRCLGLELARGQWGCEFPCLGQWLYIAEGFGLAGNTGPALASDVCSKEVSRCCAADSLPVCVEGREQQVPESRLVSGNMDRRAALLQQCRD